MNTNDKATKTPWKEFPGFWLVDSTGDYVCRFDASEKLAKTREQMALTLRAVNEHAALNAVAEVARDAFNVLDSLNLRPGHQCTATELQSALAALARVRESGVKS